VVFVPFAFVDVNSVFTIIGDDVGDFEVQQFVSPEPRGVKEQEHHTVFYATRD